MRDTYETPFDRYETPFEGDEETRRIDAALDHLNVRLVEMHAHLTRITCVLVWSVVGLSLEIIMGFGLVLWWR